MTQIYDVKRQHLGDKMYMPGDTRTAAPGDVGHLVANGVLQPKAAPKTTDKAEAKPANKAATKADDKAAS